MEASEQKLLKKRIRTLSEGLSKLCESFLEYDESMSKVLNQLARWTYNYSNILLNKYYTKYLHASVFTAWFWYWKYCKIREEISSLYDILQETKQDTQNKQSL